MQLWERIHRTGRGPTCRIAAGVSGYRAGATHTAAASSPNQRISAAFEATVPVHAAWGSSSEDLPLDLWWAEQLSLRRAQQLHSCATALAGKAQHRA